MKYLFLLFAVCFVLFICVTYMGAPQPERLQAIQAKGVTEMEARAEDSVNVLIIYGFGIICAGVVIGAIFEAKKK